ncbi:MAG: hotdog domain-containing protein [Bacteroidota bacterium]|nr:hotdog domain-containing protein [Bacteroidota bacterium]
MEEIKIPLQTKGIRKYVVKKEDTAIYQHSGEVNVLGTPRLLAMMEEVSYKSIEQFLPEGMVSVGTQMSIQHLKPSIEGEEIVCESTLLSYKDRELTFEVVVSDCRQRVGEGLCKRVIVNKERFEQKARKVALGE